MSPFIKVGLPYASTLYGLCLTKHIRTMMGAQLIICYIMSDEFSDSPFSQKPYPTPKHKTVKERELEIFFFWRK